MRHLRKGALMATTVALSLAVVSLAACAPQQATDAQQPAEDSATEQSGGYLQVVSDEPGQPKVFTHDGVEYQLTPTVVNKKGFTPFTTGETQYTSATGLSTVNYNLDILESDSRGCASCHADLWETLIAADPYHAGYSGGGTALKVTSNVFQCMDCHNDPTESIMPKLSTMIHSMHGVDTDDEKAGCFNCHGVDPDTGEMAVWEELRYKEMQGISQVPDVTGDFSFSQDEITPNDQHFNENWLVTTPLTDNYGDIVAEDMALEERTSLVEESALAEDLFNNWEITVSGEVDQETTFKLGDLVRDIPSVTTVMKEHCAINALGGPLIGQFEVTGIPLKAVLDKVGVKDGAVALHYETPDSPEVNTMMLDTPLEWLNEHEGLIVYEINGERLSWEDGYPCEIWVAGMDASNFVKQINHIVVSAEQNRPAEPMNSQVGWRLFGTAANIGLTNTIEGQIIKAGEPYTFEGYADGYYTPVAAVEFSMDGGQTWTTCPTPNATIDKWVTWEFTWTPPADIDSAYVLQMRCALADGKVTAIPLDIMVNAKAEA